MSDKTENRGAIKLKQFKAESKRLLDLMINSIYTNKEIFLRELIANASDAIDKYHYLSLTDEKLEKRNDYKIELSIDVENRTITISDNGIGMTKDELISFNRDYMTVYNHIRGLLDNPGAYSIIDGKKIKFHKVRCTDEVLVNPGVVYGIHNGGLLIGAINGSIIVDEIQSEGKNKMNANKKLNMSYTVDGKKVDIPSYACKAGDVITLKETSKNLKVVVESLESLTIPDSVSYIDSSAFTNKDGGVNKNITISCSEGSAAETFAKLYGLTLGEPIIKKFTVIFFDWDDTILSSQQVAKGEDAVAPASPTRKGYTFIGWKPDYTNIARDMSIYAYYDRTLEDFEGIKIHAAEPDEGKLDKACAEQPFYGGASVGRAGCDNPKIRT